MLLKLLTVLESMLLIVPLDILLLTISPKALIPMRIVMVKPASPVVVPAFWERKVSLNVIRQAIMGEIAGIIFQSLLMLLTFLL